MMSDLIHLVCTECGAKNRLPKDKLIAHPTCGRCKKSLFDGVPRDLDQIGFDKHIQGNDIPVLVDFWAPWCGPCKAMTPHFEAAAKQLEPSVRLIKVNTENNQNLSARLSIQSIPTLALFKNGREISRASGAMTAQNLVQWVKQNLI